MNVVHKYTSPTDIKGIVRVRVSLLSSQQAHSQQAFVMEGEGLEPKV